MLKEVNPLINYIIMYNHSKLDVSDIPSCVPDTYKKYKFLQGRDYLDLSDLPEAQPKKSI